MSLLPAPSPARRDGAAGWPTVASPALSLLPLAPLGRPFYHFRRSFAVANPVAFCWGSVIPFARLSYGSVDPLSDSTRSSSPARHRAHRKRGDQVCTPHG